MESTDFGKGHAEREGVGAGGGGGRLEKCGGGGRL